MAWWSATCICGTDCKTSDYSKSHARLRDVKTVTLALVHPHTSSGPHSAAVSTEPNSTDAESSTPSPHPYSAIAAVALIILVVCGMVYFRIRPFHRVRYLLRSRSQ
ncbi:hypothetical protein BBBOND_0311780 [Babesia bigemina]|uniref:Uncharacterized protein n=1 Tax=Babesia bigemina TaxID=5866 RepID=A0A061DEH2_BABBI|nr:hypothetical protein BBBOND_0311780 [Babesia bigemina]CDR97275.1 hypothetical protein BBBOND_0311780 [Babesia bigemina]|eukprot:XP_012769461.1 hypothetical protein BBBOND_0311780 [Babesia bigemina]